MTRSGVKRLLALLTALVMLAGALAGCGKDTAAQENSAQESGDDSTTQETTQAGELSGLSNMFPADEVMLTSNGVDVTWKQLDYFINYQKSNTESYFTQNEMETDWSADDGSGKSYAQTVLDRAVDSAVSFGALEQGAKELEVSVPQEDIDGLDDQWEQLLANYEDEETALSTLAEQGVDKDLYKQLMYYTALSDKCFEALYGTNGEKLTDEECAERTAGDGYMMAKHILMETTKTDDEGNSEDMTDEEKAEVYAKMEEILAQLSGLEGEELEKKFSEIMAEKSEDPGSQSFPEGYLFQDGQMVPEFESTVKELEEGQMSGIVQTDYGYHIILKLPINYDSIPSAYSSYMYYYDPATLSLRCLTAQSMYESVVEGWISSAKVERSKALENLDPVALMNE
ncbi:MAG: peptidylprolyl isomerase [Oscillospiraceae bacterium]|nr:peptidylprolyl isomerase [Oscillospiraceae bacterium]